MAKLKCPNCGYEPADGDVFIHRPFIGSLECPKCQQFSQDKYWRITGRVDDASISGDSTSVFQVEGKPVVNHFHTDNHRPSHYEEGNDTFSWSDNEFTDHENLAICNFMIHKYFHRKKGQDGLDYGKIADYANRAKKFADNIEMEERR